MSEGTLVIIRGDHVLETEVLRCRDHPPSGAWVHHVEFPIGEKVSDDQD